MRWGKGRRFACRRTAFGEALFGGAHRALTPGGEFVAEFGGAGNVASVVEALTAELRARGVDAPQSYLRDVRARLAPLNGVLDYVRLRTRARKR